MSNRRKRRHRASKPRAVKSRKQFYAVAIGRGGPNVYSTWPECREKIHRYHGARFKGFDSHAAALEYIDRILGGESSLREKYLDDYSESVSDEDIDSALDAVLARHE